MHEIDLKDSFHETFRRYPSTFRSSLEVVGSSRLHQASEYTHAILKAPENATTYYHGYLEELTSPLPRSEAAVITSALQNAMAVFASRDCRIPTREEVLVGLFRGAISDALTVQARVLEVQGIKLRCPRLFTMDLNVKGREAKTGGDIAFLVNIQDADGAQLIVPICLQAKRAAPQDGTVVSIERKNKTDTIGNHQLRALSAFADKGCNCAYIFFNNHSDFVIGSPILPLVKSIEDLNQEAKELHVDLATNTIDFASYTMHLLSQRSNAVTDLIGLKGLIDILVGGDISHLVLVSPSDDMWKNVLSFMGEKRSSYAKLSSMPMSRGPVDFETAFAAHNSYAPTGENGRALTYRMK